MIAGQTANTKLVLGHTFVETVESKFDTYQKGLDFIGR